MGYKLMNMNIKLINQNETDCFLACAAMVNGIPLHQVYEVYPEFNNIGITVKESILILDRLNIPHIVYASDRLFYNKTYILTVPSLNIPGGLHNIVIVNHKDNSTQTFDPNEGKEDKLFYSDRYDELNLGRNLFSWSNPIEIV